MYTVIQVPLRLIKGTSNSAQRCNLGVILAVQKKERGSILFPFYSMQPLDNHFHFFIVMCMRREGKECCEMFMRKAGENFDEKGGVST